jgi:hypothetical protein
MSKNVSFRVHNESSQSERRAVLKNEREVGTYHQIAAAEAGAVGGRFAAESKQRVVGSKPWVGYPALPMSSPWHDDPVPAEEPLGIDLSAAPIVGEVHEITASLAEPQSGGGINPISPPNGSPSGGENTNRRKRVLTLRRLRLRCLSHCRRSLRRGTYCQRRTRDRQNGGQH